MNKFLKTYLELCFWMGQQLGCAIAFLIPLGIIYLLFSII